MQNFVVFAIFVNFVAEFNPGHISPAPHPLRNFSEMNFYFILVRGTYEE